MWLCRATDNRKYFSKGGGGGEGSEGNRQRVIPWEQKQELPSPGSQCIARARTLCNAYLTEFVICYGSVTTVYSNRSLYFTSPGLVFPMLIDGREGMFSA